jgi:hypothetical protein
MLSELPEVAEALRSGVCPAKIDAETWADPGVAAS